MLNKKKLDIELITNTEIKQLVETYTEIAAARIQKIRSSVLRNRSFMEEIDKIYEEIKASYQQELSHTLKTTPEKIKRTFVIKKNGKTALVFMAANTGLYGDIIQKVFEYFLGWVKRLNENSDVIIIGKRGKLLFDEAQTGRDYIYFDFPDDSFSQEDFNKISDFLLNYDNVLAYYGIFESIGSQSAMMASLNGTAISLEKHELEPVKYLFEPSIKDILTFFETEIFISLLVQSIQESQLAKYASRMIYLDKATQTVKDKIKKNNLDRLRLSRRLINTKQQQTLAGISLWGR